MKQLMTVLALAIAISLLLSPCPTSTGVEKAASDQPDKPTSHYAKREVRGWTLRVNKDLLAAEHAKLYAEVIAEMDNHFYRIERVIPAKALAQLKKVVIWLELSNPKAGNCHYHPSIQWLKDNKYNTDKAKCVEIGCARSFLRTVKHQPCVMLHELSHAYHDQVLGFEHAGIMACYQAAKKAGTYDKVLIWNGRVGRHYAMTNQKEYFAEDTEAYFGTNDMYPFVRVELKKHDPNMYAAIKEVWGIER